MFLTTSWSVNSNLTLDDINRNSTLAAQALAQWQVNGTGPLGLSPASQFGWLRVSDSVFESFGIEDPSAGPTSAHFELIPVVSTYGLRNWRRFVHMSAPRTRQASSPSQCPYPQQVTLSRSRRPSSPPLPVCILLQELLRARVLTAPTSYNRREPHPELC